MTFVSDDDFAQFLTRTDGTPYGGFGETANGLEFFFSANGGAASLGIRTKRAGITIGAITSGPTINVVAGDIFDFTIIDEGTSGVSFTVTKVGGTFFTSTSTAVVTGDSVTPSLVSFHNREGGRRMNLDNIVISTVPEPSSSLMALGSLGLLFRRKRRA
ncbi:MAG: PEP-CTERM sorting domain-containing protein [Akkermansiaceae bacterium]